MRLLGPARDPSRKTPFNVRGFLLRFFGWMAGPDGPGTSPVFTLSIEEDAGASSARDAVLEFDLAEAMLLREALNEAIYNAGRGAQMNAGAPPNSERHKETFDAARERVAAHPRGTPMRATRKSAL